MAYLDLHKVATHSDFIKTVKMAVLKKAADVAGETGAGMNAIVVQKRQSLANTVFSNIENQAKQFALHAATYAEGVLIVNESSELIYLGGGTLDNALDSIMDTVWNDRAGVTYAELNG